METYEERKDHTAEEQQSLFPTAVSEEELQEARRRSDLRRLFGSAQILGTPGDRPDLRGALIVRTKAAEHYTNGKEAMGTSRYEAAVLCFSKAITLQPDQTRLHVSRAEAYLQLCDFQSAAACYQKARALEPGAFSDRLAFIRYIQGQCLFDRGFYQEALEAFSRAAEERPGCRALAVRRLACLTAAGHLTSALRQVSDWMASDRPTSDLYVLRARLHQQLHQTSSCYGDAKAALALNPACPAAGALMRQLRDAGERAGRRAADEALSGRLPEALCFINAALENCPQDARLHLFRGILYRRLKDFTAAIEDLVQAVELSEEREVGVEGRAEAGDRSGGRGSLEEDVNLQLVLTYNDFAVRCFGAGLYAEATVLLNRAVEEEKGLAGLYLNRGDCFFKQGEWAFALADYQQAEEMMRPDDPALRLRLAVLHNTLGSFCFQDGRFQEAADMFSVALRYDPAAAPYYESRAKAFRKLQNLEAARRDLIRLLILDPANEEVSPMLMDLFPGHRASQVLSSPVGRAVQDQLTDAIQACGSVPEPQRLSEMLRSASLTDATTSQSEGPSGAGGGRSQQELQVTVRSLLRVLDLKNKPMAP